MHLISGKTTAGAAIADLGRVHCRMMATERLRPTWKPTEGETDTRNQLFDSPQATRKAIADSIGQILEVKTHNHRRSGSGRLTDQEAQDLYRAAAAELREE